MIVSFWRKFKKPKKCKNADYKVFLKRCLKFTVKDKNSGIWIFCFLEKVMKGKPLKTVVQNCK